jgi:nitrogen regulatory protein PII
MLLKQSAFAAVETGWTFAEEEGRNAEQMWLLAVAVVVLDGHASAGVARLADVTKTGTIGEGNGVVSPLDGAVRIRMGEHGTSVR